MEALWITTEDNPFNPFEDFDNWFSFDEDNGYHTSEYIARIAETSPNYSPQEDLRATNEACMEIARLNITGVYKLVRKDIEFESVDEDELEEEPVKDVASVE